MKPYISILFLVLIAGCSGTTDTEPDNLIRCIKVIDGDTYDFLSGNDTIRVRHLYIDCYETVTGTRLDNQAKRAGISSDSALKLGFAAKKYIKELIEMKKCEVKSMTDEDDVDIYGRYLRIVSYQGQRLDSLLLAKGLALPF